MQLILEEIRRGFDGALAFLLNRPDAADRFDRSLTGFFYSFLAPLLALPLHMITTSVEITLPDGTTGAAADMDLGFYVLRWATFPLLMLPLAMLINRKAQVLSFIIGWNWSNLIIEIISLLPVMLMASAAASLGLIQAVLLILGVVLILYRWRIAKQLLEVNGWTAAAMVVIDMAGTYLVIIAAGGLTPPAAG